MQNQYTGLFIRWIVYTIRYFKESSKKLPILIIIAWIIRKRKFIGFMASEF